MHDAMPSVMFEWWQQLMEARLCIYRIMNHADSFYHRYNYVCYGQLVARVNTYSVCVDAHVRGKWILTRHIHVCCNVTDICLSDNKIA